MIFKRWVHLLSVVLFAVAFVACGGSSKPSGGSPAAGSSPRSNDATEQPRRGGTLVVALEANPKDFDPMVAGDTASLAIIPNIIEGLTKVDANYEVKPWLAEKIDASADGLTYTFALHKGVKFQDGTEMDADAVQFSMQRIRDNPKSIGYNDSQDIAELKVVDKYTIAVTLKAPNSPFLAKLTGRLGAVVSPAAVKAMGDENFNRHPVGTGPFKFIQYQSDDHVTLLALRLTGATDSMESQNHIWTACYGASLPSPQGGCSPCRRVTFKSPRSEIRTPPWSARTPILCTPSRPASASLASC